MPKQRTPYNTPVILQDIPLLVRLFNIDKLTTVDANWISLQGYDVICANGKVDDIVPAQ